MTQTEIHTAFADEEAIRKQATSFCTRAARMTDEELAAELTRTEGNKHLWAMAAYADPAMARRAARALGNLVITSVSTLAMFAGYLALTSRSPIALKDAAFATAAMLPAPGGFSPYTTSISCAPTYTLPSSTVGTPNSV